MLEPVNGTEKVYLVDLDGDRNRIVEDLGLGLLPDEVEKVRQYFVKELSLIHI